MTGLAQHTLGPWRYVARTVMAYTDGKPGIVSRGRVAVNYGNDADGHLIAAAPDLLEAGEPVVEILEEYIGFLHRIPADQLEEHPYIPTVEEAFDRLSAAIAKAKGQSA